jgi:hypothetical protein
VVGPAAAFQNSFLFHFPIQKPLTLALIDILHGAVIVDIEHLSLSGSPQRGCYGTACVVWQLNCRTNAHPKVKPAYIQRASAGCHCRVGRAHIARHLATAGKVTPRGKHFQDTIGFLLPNKSAGAVRAFLAGGRRIKDDFDGMVKEVDCLIILSQEGYTL